MGKREHIYEIIAENIRKERRRLGITQAELAERADVSLDTIKSVENGRRAMSLDTYLNIVHALESSVLYYIITLRAVFYADYGYFLFYHIHTVWCIHAPYHYRTLLRRIQGGGLCNDSI